MVYMSCIFRGKVFKDLYWNKFLYICLLLFCIKINCKEVIFIWLNLLFVLILNFIRIIILISIFYSKMDILKNIVYILLCIDLFYRWKLIFFFKEMY